MNLTIGNKALRAGSSIRIDLVAAIAGMALAFTVLGGIASKSDRHPAPLPARMSTMHAATSSLTFQEATIYVVDTQAQADEMIVSSLGEAEKGLMIFVADTPAQVAKFGSMVLELQDGLQSNPGMPAPSKFIDLRAR